MLPLEDYFTRGVIVDEGEDPLLSAHRELEEETGYRIQEVLERSPALATSAGLSDETFSYVIATAEFAGTPQLESAEEIEVLKVTLEELRVLLDTFPSICGRVWPICRGYLQAGAFPV